MTLDSHQTLALGGAMLLVGQAVRRAVPPLARYNVPGPVIGGLIAAAAVYASTIGEQRWEWDRLVLDDGFRVPAQNAFFTAIGFGASYALLKRGGQLVAGLLALTAVGAVLQNVVGASLATIMGQPALLGVLCGSVTLTGGPATGLAFAEKFKEAGVSGADVIALTAAMTGIIVAGMIGAPLGTLLIERRARKVRAGTSTLAASDLVEALLPPREVAVPPGEDRGSFVLIKMAAYVLIAMWIGGGLSLWLDEHGMNLPSYIGAMLVAAAVRNVDDATGWFGISPRVMDDLGNLALAFFLVVALMTLELWKLSAVAVPLAVILTVQIVLMALLCAWPVFRLMGRNYDAAVITSGYYGFMIGTTPVAMANMDSLVRRYGPSPRAFLVVPIVGTIILDFMNVLLIETSIQLLR
jgi:ESS family glutamate:Na+ symporter